MSAVHQAMMSRYGDREHPMPVLLDQLSGGDTGSGIACTERGSVFHLREGDPRNRGETAKSCRSDSLSLQRPVRACTRSISFCAF